MGGGFHQDLSGSSDIGQTIWKNYEIVVLQGAMQGMAVGAAVMSMLALSSF